MVISLLDKLNYVIKYPHLHRVLCVEGRPTLVGVERQMTTGGVPALTKDAWPYAAVRSSILQLRPQASLTFCIISQGLSK